MALFLLIPLVLLVLTIALAPVLAVAVVPDRGTRAGHDDPVRLPRYSGAPGGPAAAPADAPADAPVAAPVAVEAGRHLHRAA